MRLAQLARKISVTPAELIRFLQANNEFLADVNTRLTDEQLNLVLMRFAPSRVNEILIDDRTLPADETEIQSNLQVAEPAYVNEEMSTSAPAGERMPGTDLELEPELKVGDVNLTGNEPAEQNPFEGVDVIKAPKVTLSGLRVIGKIDLPEPKKKETTIEQKTVPAEEALATESSVPAAVPPKSQRKNNKYADRRGRVERPRENPIALQREREMREAEARRKEELKKEKERRTQFYNNRIKQSAPKRAARLVDEPVERLDEIQEEPKTLLGKIWRWLTT